MTDQRLFRLRIELYTAAQTLTGEDADYFWQLINEIALLNGNMSDYK